MVWATITEEEASAHAVRIGLLQEGTNGFGTQRRMKEEYFFEVENDERSPRQEKAQLMSASNGGGGDRHEDLSVARNATYQALPVERYGSSGQECNHNRVSMERTSSRMPTPPPSNQWLQEVLRAERAEVQAILEKKHRDLLSVLSSGRMHNELAKSADRERLHPSSFPGASSYHAPSVGMRTESYEQLVEAANSSPAQEEPESEKVPGNNKPSQAEIYKRLGLHQSAHKPVVKCDYTPLQEYLHTKFLDNPIFDALMAIMITMNALVIGVEIDQARHGEVSWYVKYAELMFLTIFIFELVIRIMAYGMASFGRPFLVFDFFLILFGAISFIGGQLSPASSWAKALGNLTVGRMLRLIRLTYGLRKVEWGVDLYKLATGLFSSFRTILSAFVLIAAAIYLFACVGVEVCNVQKLMDNPDTAIIVETNFGSVPKALLTFTQFVSSDSIAAIYNPLIQSEPWLAFYFIPGMLVIGIALMNLVTALIVQTAIDAAANDTEALREEKQRMIESLLPDIGEAFRRMDTSGDGTLGADELESDAILARLPEKLQEVIPTSKLTDMLETLGDTLPGGEIDEMEFAWAIVTVALGEMENKQHLCYLRRLNKDLKLLR